MPARKAASKKRKKATTSRRTVAAKKTASRKGAASKRKVTGKNAASKKRVSKKKVASKKAGKRKVTGKKSASKKRVSKKKVASKKAGKKKVASKKARKKKVASKKARKKKVASKKARKKKVARKKVAAKKVAKKKASAKKVARKPAAPKKAVSQKRPAARARAKARSDVLTGPIHGITPYKPGRSEDYMSDEQLDHFRKILGAWKSELMYEVDRTVHHMQDEAANFPDPNDRATQESEFGLELRTRDRERKLLRKIESALSRVDEGSYGFCEETGEEIGLKRLEARPVATLCVEAQERRELAERQFRDRDDRYR